MKHRVSVFFLALFILLLGLAHLLTLPPFEGIDENGHYSLIRQIAKLGHHPAVAEVYLDKAIDEYRKNAPTAYAVMAPYEKNGGMIYPDFFSKPELVNAYAGLYRTAGTVKTFEASQEHNWQQQHPPAYYLLLAPVQKAVEGFSFLDQFLILRLFSYLLAVSGVLIGLYGTLRYTDGKLHKPIIATFALYPFLFMQFTPEFARLGNDSLCLFLFGILWTLFLRWLKNEHDPKGNLLMGLVLALGLLTKAFFLPITAGFFAFAVIRMLVDRKDKVLFGKRFDDLVLIAMPIVICGFWYIFKWKSTGVFLGHFEYNAATEKGDLINVFLERVNPKSLLISIFGVLFTWTWAGTASLGRFSDLFHYPYLFFVLWLFVYAFKNLKTRPFKDPLWLVSWILFFFIVGILHHMIVIICIDDMGGTPGWYLHILMPAVAYMLSFALVEIWQSKFKRVLFGCLFAYSMYFFASVMWSTLTMYSGCSRPLAHKYLAFSDQAYCLSKVPEVMQNMSSLGWPYAAVACFAGAIAAFLLCFHFLFRSKEV